MNILAIADRRPKIDIPEVVKQHNVELIVTLGDLTREDILGLAQVRHVPKIGVYGNHDSGRYMPELGIMNIHRKIWDFAGLRFGGFEGCVRYKDNPEAIMYTQQEAKKLMVGYPAVDVFISHCPPKGINDEDSVAHQGFDALREYMDLVHPKLWLHGHTYPDEETVQKQHGTTRIEYVFGYSIVSI